MVLAIQSSKDVRVNTQCRICKSADLALWLDLGAQPLANSFLKKEQLDLPEPRYPLRAFFCGNCSLSQLVDIVNPEVMFRDYVYFSSNMPKVSEHWRNYALEVKSFLSKPDDFVVEIGSNDGVLLGVVQELGARVLGVDPARNIAKLANQRGVETLPEFFTQALAKKIAQERGKARVVIGNNVVAHINDHHDLLSGVAALMDKDSVFAFEAPYLVDMFENLTFDTIYHEHMSQLALIPVVKLLDQFGLEVFDAKIHPIQGNSIRAFAARKGAKAVKPSVGEILKKEKELSLDKLETYLRLAKKIASLKDEVRKVCDDFKKEGKKLAAYGAPAKGNTLLNYYEIGAETLDFATEELASKIGFYTPGTHIPVVDVAWARKNPPDYYLFLAWNYKDAVLAKEKDFTGKGGKFIMPVGPERIIP